MRESNFASFLVQDSNIESKDKAVRTRISKAKKVEDTFHISLDTIVKNDEDMYQTLKRIQLEFGDKNGAIQNAVRKYYIFINNKPFPTLSQYEKRSR